MSNFKWTTEKKDKNLPYYVVVLMVSRNKDNKSIEYFKERRKSYFTILDIEKIQRDFSHFVKEGVSGEFCRLYISCNARNPKKVHQLFLHFLIDHPDYDFFNVNSTLAGLAAKKECALEKKWLFDFDNKDLKLEEDFEKDILLVDKTIEMNTYPTPHGFAIITNHGFDTRKLMSKWGKIVSLKRDALLCYDWGEK